MPGSSAVRVGRLAGIPIGIHPLWLAVVALLTAGLGSEYYPDVVDGLSEEAAYALGLASVLTLFAGILAHELGHAIVARRHGVEIEEIDLWLLGGVARMRDEPPTAEAELRFALAGPAVTAALLTVMAAILVAGDGAWPEWVLAFLGYQVYVNAAILAFNLLPAFPLDGGRVLRAVLWRRTGDRDAATVRAGRLGARFGWAFVALGVAATLGGANGLWLALIGVFVVVAARAEQARADLHRRLGDLRVAEVMVHRPVTVPGDLTVTQAIDAVVARHLFTAYPVVDGAGRALGLVTLDELRRPSDADRARLHVADVTLRDPQLTAAADTPVAELVLRAPFARVGRAVVVGPRLQVVGLLSMTDVQHRVTAAELLRPAA